MKTENWNGHEIRFVDINDEWWAVAKDVAEALGLKQVTRAIHSLPKDGVTTSKVIDSLGRTQDVNIINEKNIYRMAFKSRKKRSRGISRLDFRHHQRAAPVNRARRLPSVPDARQGASEISYAESKKVITETSES